MHKLQNARQARMDNNMVKSSRPNAPSTWLTILCSRTHAKTSESVTFIRTRERQREKFHCKYTTLCTVHFIITLFNVGNVLVCVIYQLNFTVFMCVKRISYIWRSVLSAGSHNRGRFWNVLPVDTGALLYFIKGKFHPRTSHGDGRGM
jgi:hypothetical protein